MFLGAQRVSRCSSNCSAINALDWGKFDFEVCNGYEFSLYIWACFTAVCFVIGLPASVAILWEFFKSQRSGAQLTPNTFLILNMSVMDATFFIFIPPGIINYFYWQSLSFEAVWNGIYALNLWGRPLLMACVCLEGYFAVVHPVIYHKNRSLKPRIAVASVVWALTAAAGVSYSLSYKLYYTMFTVVPYIVAMVIIAICDSFIVYALVTSNPSRKHIHPQKQRAIQTLVNSLVMVAISYLPPTILLAGRVQLFKDWALYVCTISIPITITTTMGSTIMPILYLNNLGKFHSLRRGCK